MNLLLPARGQLLRRDHLAQHRGHPGAQGRRVLHRRLPLRARPPTTPAGSTQRRDRGRRPARPVRREQAAAAQARRHDRLPHHQQRRPERRQRPGGVRRHAGRRPGTGGTDNDTFWGGANDDVIDGNSGNDVVFAGDGNDMVTDSNGDDTLEGGPGDDAIDGGPGIDLLLGGDGRRDQRRRRRQPELKTSIRPSSFSAPAASA